MIRQDFASKILISIAMMLTIYLATYETTALVMFPAVLLIVGLGMELYLERHRKPEYVDFESVGARSRKEIFYYSVLALLGIFTVGYSTSFLSDLEVAGFSMFAFMAVMAIAEEQFFRGFITDLFLTHLDKDWIALLTSALVFMGYHLARYGTSPDALLYVFGGGLILNWVAWKSKRISPCMIAHVINNIVALISLGVYET